MAGAGRDYHAKGAAVRLIQINWGRTVRLAPKERVVDPQAHFVAPFRLNI